jgi:bifunctional non-homologous end joining protein LigD
LEGVVAKRLDSAYEPGSRSGAWRKMRINLGQEFVIGGYTVGGKNFDAVIAAISRTASSCMSHEPAMASRRR